jgi:hypothetical protein
LRTTPQAQQLVVAAVGPAAELNIAESRVGEQRDELRAGVDVMDRGQVDLSALRENR